MKNAILILMLQFLCTILLIGQNPILSDQEQIRVTIEKYAKGTSYNLSTLTKEAFIPGAKMFLDHKDKPLFVLSIEEYAENMEKYGKSNVYNGRITNILSIDIFEGIANAKLEVLIPKSNRRYVDILLLKRLESGWKIISKTAASTPYGQIKDKVLIVVSNSEYQGDSKLPAGNSFSEIVLAYDTYKKAGYQVDFLSPKGGQIPLVYVNSTDSLQLQYLYDTDFMFALKNTTSPENIEPNLYSIIQFTGGSGPIFDIPNNKKILNIALVVYEKEKGIIVAVCHGTAVLRNLKTTNGLHIVTGKKVTGVPDSHESKNLAHYEQYPFIIEKELKRLGANFIHSNSNESHLEIDGRLITGQNSLTSVLASQASINLLESLKVSKNE